MVRSKRSVNVSSEHDSEFVDGRQRKRLRVSRACDYCRSIRERCEGTKPCRTCTSQNRECTYDGPVKKRGIQPNYIRSLELTLAWLFQTNPQAELNLSRSLSQDGSDIRVLLDSKDSGASETFHNVFRNSVICKQLDQLLSGRALIDNGQYIGNMRADARSSLELPYQSPPPSTDTEMGLSVNQTSSAPRSMSLLSPESEASSRLIKLPHNAWSLIEHYFAFTHSWLPMLEKHELLKLMYAYPREGFSSAQIAVAESAELWSVMALAASQLSDGSDPDQVRDLRSIAESFIPTIQSGASYQVPHIKAMIVLALIDATEERILAAWLRIGTVVSLLLLFEVLKELPAQTKWCRHMHRVAFILESALAWRLTVPTHFRSTYILGMGPVEEDGLDEWSPWHDPEILHVQNSQLRAPVKALSTLNKLVRIAAESSESGSGADADTNNDISVVFNLLRNATLKSNRIQPAILLASERKGRWDRVPIGQTDSNAD